MRNCQISFRHSHGNLHIETKGGFDGDAAEKLLKLFCTEYHVGSRIFVDTAGVEDIHPFGRKVLTDGLPGTSVPVSSLFFKGEKGFDMAPDGSRVLILKQNVGERKITDGEHRHAGHGEHHCCGKCAHCTCRHTTNGNNG